MKHSDRLARIVMSDSLRWRLLADVRSMGLPDCWIGAGFVRDAVWDALHGRPLSPPAADIDVVWFDPDTNDPAHDDAIEEALIARQPGFDWSVKNQARMHLRNADAPYASTEDALCHWTETATAVAVRRTADDRCEILAPFGLAALFELRLSPPQKCDDAKRKAFRRRVTAKRWLERYPKLNIVGG